MTYRASTSRNRLAGSLRDQDASSQLMVTKHPEQHTHQRDEHPGN